MAARYKQYRGKNIYKVEHPEHEDVHVYAPDRDSAIVAAAKVWDAKWTALEFYTRCTVTLM